MNFKNRFSLKPWIALGIFILCWLILPPTLKSFTRISFFEMQAPVWKGITNIKDLQTYWSLRNHSKKNLIEAGRDLARLNAAYELSLSENTYLKHEVKRLETLLDIESLAGFDHILARISRRDLTNWWHHLYIQKGSKHGIIEGAAVIYGRGIVGRIKEVHYNSSIVELISSPTFRIAAHFINDERPVTYQGYPNIAFSQPRGHADNIPTDIVKEENNILKLVSSHLGGIFPDGLNIGEVTTFEPSTNGLFNQAKVSLDPALHKIQEVVILIPSELI